jgi:hypothetical protein
MILIIGVQPRTAKRIFPMRFKALILGNAEKIGELSHAKMERIETFL